MKTIQVFGIVFMLFACVMCDVGVLPKLPEKTAVRATVSKSNEQIATPRIQKDQVSKTGADVIVHVNTMEKGKHQQNHLKTDPNSRVGKRAVDHVKLDEKSQKQHQKQSKKPKIHVLPGAATTVPQKRFQTTNPMIMTEYNTQLEFSTTLDGCESKKLGYLSAQIVWPVWKTIAALCKYVCSQQVLDETALVLALYLGEVGKDSLKSRLKERIGATNAQQQFIIPNIEHRQKLDSMLNLISVEKMEYKDKIYFIYNSNVLTFNIKTARNGEYLATMTDMPRAIVDQIEETFSEWYYSD